MKAKGFHSIILQLAICFFVLNLSTLSFSVGAQTIYHVNGRTILIQNNKYFDITTSDSVMVDTKHLTIEFHPTREAIGNSKITLQNNAKLFYSSTNKQFFYKLDTLNDYINTLTNIISDENISKVYISYLFKGKVEDNQNTAATNNMNNSVPDDPYFDYDMDNAYLTNMQMPEAWSIETGKSSIRIAFIGLGCDWNCADLPPANSIGFNFMDGTNNTNLVLPFLYQMHFASQKGTRETSVISARTNNNLYMSGIAGGWNGNGGITPVHYVVGEILGMGTYYNTATIAAAINKSIEDDVKVINFTLYPPPTEDISSALQSAYEKGVVVVASVGNYYYNNDHSILFPATEEHVIAVGGSQLTMDRLSAGDRYYYDERNWYNFPIGSRFGSGLEVTANAKNVVTLSGYMHTFGTQTTNVFDDQGTEYSASIVAGVAGLILSANNCLSPDEVKEIIIKSCEKLGGYNYNSSGWCNELGYGRVNAKTAVEFAKGLVPATITSSSTWDTDRFSGDIIINPGVTLTLNNMTLRMADEKSITVKVGGKLIVSKSVITTECNTVSHRWKGIRIEGNPGVWNANINLQGYAKIDNNSRIENARTAIDIVYSDNMGLISGGMVQAKNSVFLNNDLAFSFGEYGFRSGSSFNRCSFVIDQDYYGNVGVDQPMASLWGNNGVQFIACTFTNNKTANNGIGIVSYGSSYSINALCESSTVPCPESSLIKPQFNNLAYGIHSYNTSNKIIINNAIFSSQRGVCLTNCNYADILNTQFNIPKYYLGGIMPYGAYMDQGTGYHIEKNTFTGQNPNNTGNIGLYLFNTGSSQNYVYRNTFSNLSRAAVSDGNNRSSTGNVGLCFKCNDFSTNGTDIDVIPTPGAPQTLNVGISRYQGFPYPGNPNPVKDTLAAANTFTLLANYNMSNYSGNTTEYYYHGINEEPTYKIYPDPVYQIARFPNTNTKYNRSKICKSWINGGGIVQQQLAQKSEAKTNAEAVSVQLQNTVDGGSTENLTFEVLGSIPPEALGLRDQLLLESPYLSDTVIKTAIDKENVLPNAMLRDILVQNPQAAKSDEIMNKLDERWEPMPDYMKEEIEDGKDIIGGREQLHAVQAAWQQQEGLLFNQIVSAYLSDTLSPNPLTELKSFLQNDNTSRACFVLADLCLQKGDYTGAVQAIITAQSNYSLTSDENQLATGYLSLSEMLAGLENDNVSRYAVDSTHAIPLFAFYHSGANNATAIARDILIASGLLSYQEPINDVSDSLKSAMVAFPEIKQNKRGQNNSDQLSLSPNPATTYTIIGYMLPSKSNNALLSIRNMNGTLVWTRKLTKTRDQLVADISILPNGVYSVSLQIGTNLLTTKNLIIAK